MHDAREIRFLERTYMRACGTAYDETRIDSRLLSARFATTE
jgi:hypothetical protein